MATLRHIALFFIGLFLIIALDLLWFNVIMKDFYSTQLKDLTPEGGHGSRALVGLAAWGLLVLGILVFVLPKSGTLAQAALYGALFGLVVYGTYDFTNYAILKGYPLAFTLVDTLWGTFIWGVMGLVLKLLSERIIS